MSHDKSSPSRKHGHESTGNLLFLESRENAFSLASASLSLKTVTHLSLSAFLQRHDCSMLMMAMEDSNNNIDVSDF